LAYRLGDKRRFECYDGLLYKEAGTSRANFYRIKAEMDQADSAVSLFISRKPTQYQRDGDVTKPGPTVYYVRLDDVLTPGDAAHLTAWLQGQQAERRAEAVLALLQEASSQRPSELLAPRWDPIWPIRRPGFRQLPWLMLWNGCMAKALPKIRPFAKQPTPSTPI
jgi:hypothetical protein